MKRQPVAIIMRGLPGSGKSSTARSFLSEDADPRVHILSTDDYFIQDALRVVEEWGDEFDDKAIDDFMRETYVENYDNSKITAAHAWNIERWADAVKKGVDPVICDNTNVMALHMKPYVVTAQEAGYEVQIRESVAPWWVDHRHMLESKPKFARELEKFARFLGGVHYGLSAKYGVRGNVHEVPLDYIRLMIRKWQPNVTIEDILASGKPRYRLRRQAAAHRSVVHQAVHRVP